MLARPSFLLFAAMLLAAELVTPSPAVGSSSRSSELIAQASELGLAHDPEWLALLQYQGGRTRFGRYLQESEITSQGFFLDPNGRNDPNAELVATVRGLLAPIPADADLHARCRYPARAAWLIDRLPVQEMALPAPACPDFRSWSQQGKVRSISLVFASGYFANPASFYGHLLLKFNREDESGTEGMLDPSLNYGAILPERENPFFYVVKGLFGGYEAAFSHESFYKYDHLYADEQLRDLWEYELELSPEEVERVVAQSWELLGARFGYLFLNRNCATQMARLLESVVGTPLLEVRPWHIPVTIFHRLASAERNGAPLVRAIRHLPSRQRRLHSRFAELSEGERVIVRAFAESQPDFADERYGSLPEDRKVLLCEALMDYYAFRLAASPSGGEFERARLATLRERLRLAPGEAPTHFASEAPPHEAQPPGLVQVSPFYNQERGAGVDLRIRATYFDLLSLDAGRPSESALSMLDLRLAITEDRVWLRNLDLVKLETWDRSRSGLPGDGGLAWGLAVGAGEADLKCEDCTVFRVKGGIGRARELGDTGRVIGLAMLDARLQSPRFETRTKGSELFALAPRISLLGSVASWWRTSLSASYRVYLDGRDSGRPVIRLENRFGDSRLWDIRMIYERDGSNEVKGAISLYW
jgi:hypothetical protein